MAKLLSQLAWQDSRGCKQDDAGMRRAEKLPYGRSVSRIHSNQTTATASSDIVNNRPKVLSKLLTHKEGGTSMRTGGHTRQSKEPSRNSS